MPCAPFSRRWAVGAESRGRRPRERLPHREMAACSRALIPGCGNAPEGEMAEQRERCVLGNALVQCVL